MLAFYRNLPNYNLAGTKSIFQCLLEREGAGYYFTCTLLVLDKITCIGVAPLIDGQLNELVHQVISIMSPSYSFVSGMMILLA